MRFHHVGLAVASIAKHVEVLEQALDIALLGPPVTDHGQGVTVAFLGAQGATGGLIELVEPHGKPSPIDGVLERGGGLYHVCYEVEDIEAAVTRAKKAGSLVIVRPRAAPAFDGRRIAFVRVPDGTVVEFLEAQQPGGTGGT
jgi:methylmalonyl-CoA/ethylmalonyl-CoA epimerase